MENESLELLMRSAESQNGYANNFIGMFYDEGICVEKDLQKALEYYLKSSELGHLRGSLNAGITLFDVLISDLLTKPDKLNQELMENSKYQFQKCLQADKSHEIHMAAKDYLEKIEALTL